MKPKHHRIADPLGQAYSSSPCFNLGKKFHQMSPASDEESIFTITASGSASLPTVFKTRRRALDYAEDDGNGNQNNHGLHDLEQQQQQHRVNAEVGFCTMLRRRVNLCLRPEKNLNRWISGVLMILAVSTIIFKIMLMSTFLEVHSNRDFSDFLRRPQTLEETSGFFVPENFIHIQRRTLRRQQIPEIWTKPRSSNFYKCMQRSKHRKGNSSTGGTGYIIVRANGGLNQMKTGISDMVAIAKLMNATMILPSLDHKSYWTDSSDFKDIFDWKLFIEALKDDILVLESLPASVANVKPLKKAPISWSKPRYYKKDMYSLLKRYKVIEFTHTDSRLSNNGFPSIIQKLRCHAMYEALRFSKDIEELGQKLVSRLRTMDDHYIALHLRYEKDMLAFTGCKHNLTKTEAEELRKLRYITGHWKEKRINSTERRLQGACPLTPREAAVFLEALGFPSNTTIYIASGEIYGRNGMKDFTSKYPNTYSHSTLALEEELVPFQQRQNKLAALDYIVSIESDVFAYTYEGHMAKAVRGHRVFKDYLKTIDPDKKRFVTLIDRLDQGSVTWEEFSSKIKNLHKNRIGGPSYRVVRQSPKLEETFYANPLPGCICEN